MVGDDKGSERGASHERGTHVGPTISVLCVVSEKFRDRRLWLCYFTPASVCPQHVRILAHEGDFVTHLSDVLPPAVVVHAG